MGQSFDMLLGDSKQRYMADGYRNVRHSITASGAQVRSLREPSLEKDLTANVIYRDDWSIKPGGTVKPHLSTLDGLILGAAVTELRLRGMFKGSNLPTAEITDIVIKAGTAPTEVDQTLPVSWTERTHGSELTCHVRIGSMSVSVTASAFVPDVRAQRLGPRGPLTLSAISAQAAAHENAAFIASNVIDLNFDEMYLISEHELPWPQGAACGTADTAAGFTYADFLRLSAQAAQVLIYGIDHVARNASTNLWMISAHFSALDGDALGKHVLPLVTRIDAARSVLLRGQRWRLFRVVFNFGTIMRCAGSLAYKTEIENTLEKSVNRDER